MTKTERKQIDVAKHNATYVLQKEFAALEEANRRQNAFAAADRVDGLAVADFMERGQPGDVLVVGGDGLQLGQLGLVSAHTSSDVMLANKHRSPK